MVLGVRNSGSAMLSSGTGHVWKRGSNVIGMLTESKNLRKNWPHSPPRLHLARKNLAKKGAAALCANTTRTDSTQAHPARKRSHDEVLSLPKSSYMVHRDGESASL